MNVFFKYCNLFFVSIFFNCGASDVPILIMTHHYKRTDFIELQYKTLKKFLKDPYEFIVFNDAPSANIEQEINRVCKRLGIRCIRIPQEIHARPYLKRESLAEYNSFNVRCANVVQYSLDVLGFDYPGMVVILDSDMFLIRELSIKEYMKNYDLAGCWQSRSRGDVTVSYLWNGLVFFNMPSLPKNREINFNCGSVDGVGTDVGGYLYYYFKKYSQLKIASLPPSHIEFLPKTLTEIQKRFTSKETDFLMQRPSNIEFFCDDHFLHYRGGQNWDHQSPEYHQKKMAQFTHFIDEIIK
jgi:hypothetical protein